MNSRDIRQQFLDFFAARAHTIVPSSAVVPQDDPTLMFTNAGMNQFKDVFLGSGTRPFRRAADTQKCIRAGGKHNDLDDVGQDTYHHTFFEMLGNWSFGDYFKREAISWAWELLTGVWGIDRSRLHATYFEGDAAEGLEPDSEAAALWREVTDIAPANIHPGSKKDNFWEMGDNGPCGPCSEIHVDLTPDRSGSGLVNAGDPRVIEIWNLVFIQYNRGSDGWLSLLPARHVDTGMGFERICTVLQGKRSNYDTDVFAPLFVAIRERTRAPEYQGTLPPRGLGAGDGAGPVTPQTLLDVSYRVIADHVRCLTFALTDGALPGNEGRGYVLRRILRRAVRYGRQYLNMHEPFLGDLVHPLVEHMGAVFPELRTAHGGRNVARVAEILRDEEISFGRTLDRGIRLFGDAAAEAERHHHGRITGEDAFKLHDTYGFPIDLTEQMAEERGLTVNIGEYERLMDEARTRARSGAGAAADFDMNIVTPLPPTDDSPKYSAWLGGGIQHAYGRDLQAATLLGYVRAGRLIDGGAVPRDATVALVLDRTTFYGEQGGQVGDTGLIAALPARAGTKQPPQFRVRDTRRFGDTVLHIGTLLPGEENLQVGDAVTLQVDMQERFAIMGNHTATHLLNWALREVLGEGVQQKGSLVDATKTRFDFAHGQALAAGEITRVEQLVNERIAARQPVCVEEVELARARDIKTLRAIFDEKYADTVRVVAVGAEVRDLLRDPANTRWMQFPVELCGGTHLGNSGEAEHFVLVAEEAVAKGVRRLIGLSGAAARRAEQAGMSLLGRIHALRNRPAHEVTERLAELQREAAAAMIPLRLRHELQERLADLQKTVKAAEKEQAAAAGGAVQDRVAALLAQARTLQGVSVVVGEVPTAGSEALRGAIDWVRNKTPASAVLLASAEGGKVTLIAGMSREAVERGLKAGDLIKELAPLVGGKGGGRPDMAQGGGDNPAGLPAALARAREWLAGKLG